MTYGWVLNGMKAARASIMGALKESSILNVSSIETLPNTRLTRQNVVHLLGMVKYRLEVRQ